jgi:hypothetical protein
MSTAHGRGRRIAERARSRPDRSIGLAVVLVLVAVVAVLLSGSPRTARLADPAAGTVVDHTLLVCPGPPEAPRPRLRSTAYVGLAPVGGPSGALGDGGPVSVGAPGDGDTVELRRGVMREVPGDRAAPLEATGDVAAGLFAQRQDTRGDTLAVQRCLSPQADWWFTGAGAGLDHSSVLVLANVDPGPAVVDVRVLGADGPIETVGTRGITLAPGETRTLVLTDVAPQNDELAVAVHATRGRVAAAASDSFRPRPAAPSGLEWLPGTDRPGHLVRLAGLPARADRRTLVVGNPGDREALVDLEVIGSRGSFVPSGFETLSVAPGSVRTLDLTDMLVTKEAMALQVTAQVPVVATVRSVRTGDHADAATVSSLTDPAAVVLGPAGRDVVQLSAGAAGATVTVAGYTRSGRVVGTDELEIGGSSTTTWTPDERADYVVVTPKEGNVYGALAVGGRGSAVVPLVRLPVRVSVPGVVPAPR